MIYQAWTKGKDNQEVYTELQCSSKKEFKKRMKEQGRTITSKIFRKVKIKK